MKRILSIIALVVLVTIETQAQGAGLSQGQAVKQTTPNPTQTRKTCSNCGITMGNITYAWQHESWCPYYRSQGGSSSQRSRSTYTAANAAATALGALLSGLMSDGFSLSTKPSAIRQEQEAKQKELMKIVNYNSSMFIQSMLADEKYWEVGDYIVVEGKQKYEGKQAYGILNKVTGKYVLDPNETKHKDGDFALFRKLRQGKKIVDPKDKEFLRAQIRLLAPPEGDPSGKPFVFCQYLKKYQSKSSHKGSYWTPWETVDAPYWFQITDDGQLKQLEYVAKGQLDNYYYVRNRGKVGIYELYNNDEYSYNSISGYADKVKSTNIYCNLCIPAIYDNIICIGDAYRAILGAEYDLYLYNSNQYPYFVKANTGMKLFDTLNKKDIEDLGSTYIASLNGKYGLVNLEGQIILPLIYNKAEDLPFNNLKTISYTLWYKQEAAKYIDKKGEFEKTDHFEARMKDAKMQEEYLRDIMADAPERYMDEKVWQKGELKLTLGEYNADEECFPISLEIAPWNSIMLPVPIAEAKDFKKEFAHIKSEAAKNAQLGIRNDAPSVEAITFTTSSGEAYSIRGTD